MWWLTYLFEVSKNLRPWCNYHGMCQVKCWLPKNSQRVLGHPTYALPHSMAIGLMCLCYLCGYKCWDVFLSLIGTVDWRSCKISSTLPNKSSCMFPAMTRYTMTCINESLHKLINGLHPTSQPGFCSICSDTYCPLFSNFWDQGQVGKSPCTVKSASNGWNCSLLPHIESTAQPHCPKQCLICCDGPLYGLLRSSALTKEAGDLSMNVVKYVVDVSQISQAIVQSAQQRASQRNIVQYRNEDVVVLAVEQRTINDLRTSLMNIPVKGCWTLIGKCSKAS